MLLLELMLAFFVALVLAVLLAYPFGRTGPGPLNGLLFFFVLLFLAVWAGGAWLTPVGPPAWGVPWVGFVLVGVILAMILTAAAPPRPTRSADPDSPVAEAAALSLGLFFYLAIFALLAAIIYNYAWAT